MSRKKCEGAKGAKPVVMVEPANAGLPDGGDEIRRPKAEIRRKTGSGNPKQGRSYRLLTPVQ
jgi:hypothetical protein